MENACTQHHYSLKKKKKKLQARKVVWGDTFCSEVQGYVSYLKFWFGLLVALNGLMDEKCLEHSKGTFIMEKWNLLQD